MFPQFFALSSVPRTSLRSPPGGGGRREGKPHPLGFYVLLPLPRAAHCFSSLTRPRVESGVWFQGDEKPVLLVFPSDLAVFPIAPVRIRVWSVCFRGPWWGGGREQLPPWAGESK